jgi:hypothetical protein
MHDRQPGWTKIPARRVGRLSDEELRALELDENTERVDLLDYEASKQRLAEMHQAEAEAKREAEEQARREAEERANSATTRAKVAPIELPRRSALAGRRSPDPDATSLSEPACLIQSSAAPSATWSSASASPSSSVQAGWCTTSSRPRNTS